MNLKGSDNMSDNVYTVEQIRKILFPVFKRHEIKKAILFGSYAKGKAGKKSDVDLLVDSSLTGLRFVGLVEDIRCAVDKDVDVFDVSHIEQGTRIDSEIAETGVTIYEK